MDNKKGQSTVEFLLTFIFALAILFTFVQLAINAGQGYLLHYATYMMSRNYLVFDDNNINVDNTDAAAEDFIRNDMINELGLEKIGINLGELKQKLIVNGPGETNKKFEFVGVQSQIERKFSALSIIGGPITANFVSESFLGKEPTRGTCLRRLCEYVMTSHLQFTCAVQQESLHITLFDNGC